MGNPSLADAVTRPDPICLRPRSSTSDLPLAPALAEDLGLRPPGPRHHWSSQAHLPFSRGLGQSLAGPFYGSLLGSGKRLLARHFHPPVLREASATPATFTGATSESPLVPKPWPGSPKAGRLSWEPSRGQASQRDRRHSTDRAPGSRRRWLIGKSFYRRAWRFRLEARKFCWKPVNDPTRIKVL